MDTVQKHTPAVLLGITGGIAAYKAAELIRVLQKRGYDVSCVMTKHALEFIGAATIRGLTGHPVAIDDFAHPCEPMQHLSLAQSCDLFVIAPATANVIAKIAWGVADDLLTTTALATKAPLVIAPAMNTAMWQAQQSQQARALLAERGVLFVEPASGYLACGDVGEGKLASVVSIADAVSDQLEISSSLEGKTVLITGGPTREPLDNARYISNRSSGKMAYALARQAQARGAHVVLISGPVSLPAPRGVKRVMVMTAREMLDAARAFLPEVDLLIGAAAVSDYRAREVSARKIKKNGASLTLELVENPDVIATLSAELKELNPNALAFGFAAEDTDIERNAREKLARKQLDGIIANNIALSGVGFESDENEVMILTEHERVDVARGSKERVASHILDALCQLKGACE